MTKNRPHGRDRDVPHRSRGPDHYRQHRTRHHVFSEAAKPKPFRLRRLTAERLSRSNEKSCLRPSRRRVCLLCHGFKLQRWVLVRGWKSFVANRGARLRVWRTVPTAIKSHVGERPIWRLAQACPDHKGADDTNDDPEGRSAVRQVPLHSHPSYTTLAFYMPDAHQFKVTD